MFSDEKPVAKFGDSIIFANLEEMYQTLSDMDGENWIPDDGLKEGIDYEYVFDEQNII